MTQCHPKFREVATSPRIRVRRLSAEEEGAYVDHLVGRLPFYRKHGYHVVLPNDPVVDELATPIPDTERGHLHEKLMYLVQDEMYSSE